MAIWAATVALRSEFGDHFFFYLTQLNILEYKWHLATEKNPYQMHDAGP